MDDRVEIKLRDPKNISLPLRSLLRFWVSRLKTNNPIKQRDHDVNCEMRQQVAAPVREPLQSKKRGGGALMLNVARAAPDAKASGPLSSPITGRSARFGYSASSSTPNQTSTNAHRLYRRHRFRKRRSRCNDRHSTRSQMCTTPLFDGNPSRARGRNCHCSCRSSSSIQNQMCRTFHWANKKHSRRTCCWRCSVGYNTHSRMCMTFRRDRTIQLPENST